MENYTIQPFDWFVIPFLTGLSILVGILIYKYTTWVLNLPREEFAKVKKGFFSYRSLSALKETFMECLLHRRIFRVNPLLGYMHSSLALGWFLLIVIGNWESRIFYHGHISPPYIPIFFRFFNPNPPEFKLAGFFSFIMDFVLLIVLSGVALAWIKRLRSRYFGMKKTTVLRLGDKLALTSLWFIFPLRFLAESFTSSNMGGGNFLTSNAGFLLGSILPAHLLAYPAWWCYSIALGCFFIALPFSRYMHIPTEIILIFLRKYGVTEKAIYTSYTEVEVNSCSRCGICIDPCQLATSAGIRNVQSVYHLQSVRNNEYCSDNANNCFMCGRCDVVCPVGIDIASLRVAGRMHDTIQKEKSFTYIPKLKSPLADVIFFAGCMTQLQPSVKRSMVELMKEAKIKYWFMDESESICCGRPLQLAGKKTQALELMAKNKEMIESSKAKVLVTSCPICYKMFREEYKLELTVLHHSEYLLQLIENGQLKVNQQRVSAVYHDPCELGRGSGIYEQPRRLLKHMVQLKKVSQEKDHALCCGGSLANLKLSVDTRNLISTLAVNELTSSKPDLLVTGCPKCKATFSQTSPVQVLDIAEIVSKSLVRKDYFVELTNLVSKNNENKLTSDVQLY